MSILQVYTQERIMQYYISNLDEYPHLPLISGL